MVVYSISIYISHLLIQSSVDGHLACFLALAIVKSTAINSGEYEYMHFSFPLFSKFLYHFLISICMMKNNKWYDSLSKYSIFFTNNTASWRNLCRNCWWWTKKTMVATYEYHWFTWIHWNISVTYANMLAGFGNTRRRLLHIIINTLRLLISLCILSFDLARHKYSWTLDIHRIFH